MVGQKSLIQKPLFRPSLIIKSSKLQFSHCKRRRYQRTIDHDIRRRIPRKKKQFMRRLLRATSRILNVSLIHFTVSQITQKYHQKNRDLRFQSVVFLSKQLRTQNNLFSKSAGGRLFFDQEILELIISGDFRWVQIFYKLVTC